MTQWILPKPLSSTFLVRNDSRFFSFTANICPYIWLFHSEVAPVRVATYSPPGTRANHTSEMWRLLKHFHIQNATCSRCFIPATTVSKNLIAVPPLLNASCPWIVFCVSVSVFSTYPRGTISLSFPVRATFGSIESGCCWKETSGSWHANNLFVPMIRTFFNWRGPVFSTTNLLIPSWH